MSQHHYRIHMNNNWKTKISSFLILFCAFSLAVMMSTGFVWHFSGKHAIQLKRVVILNPSIKPGENLRVEYEITKDDACQVWTDRYITNERDETINVEQSTTGFIEQSNNTKVILIRLPNDIQPGKWMYFSRYTYQCNPIADSTTLSTPGVSFVVIAK